MDSSISLSKYNFDEKSFSLSSTLGNDTYFRFDDAYGYKIYFNNGDKFNKFLVADENLASKIEGMRAKFDSFSIKIYFYIAETKIGETGINTEITKVQIYDKNKTLLGEI